MRSRKPTAMHYAQGLGLRVKTNMITPGIGSRIMCAITPCATQPRFPASHRPDSLRVTDAIPRVTQPRYPASHRRNSPRYTAAIPCANGRDSPHDTGAIPCVCECDSLRESGCDSLRMRDAIPRAYGYAIPCVCGSRDSLRECARVIRVTRARSIPQKGPIFAYSNPNRNPYRKAYSKGKTGLKSCLR
jgi:hypothetical protein